MNSIELMFKDYNELEDKINVLKYTLKLLHGDSLLEYRALIA